DDGDGIINFDNCPLFSNPDQKDNDNDNLGDACDDDDDNDAIPDREDYCPLLRSEHDPLDSDLDGIPDTCDNCDNVANADQLNFDDDITGDACDRNYDGDNFPNTIDQCLMTSIFTGRENMFNEQWTPSAQLTLERQLALDVEGLCSHRQSPLCPTDAPCWGCLEGNGCFVHDVDKDDCISLSELFAVGKNRGSYQELLSAVTESASLWCDE
ncbi:MAG: thrombospondin type 3 repeat-containing protein, partial [Nanoarchaeota archaeon]